MDKVEKILERYKIYLGVKDVKVVVRPYKTRTAFTNLSSPPTIYLNEYLIDDEEVVEYLILRELIHIRLHMYPPMRYGTPSMSYAEKFDGILHFFIPKEKVEEIREDLFFLLFMGPPSGASCPAAGAPPEGQCRQRMGKKRLVRLRYISTGIRSQV